MSRNKRLSHTSPKREQILKEISEIKGKIKFPDYNPPPKSISEMTEKERKTMRNINNKIRKKKWEEKIKGKNGFIGWEYKDRFSYRKT